MLLKNYDVKIRILKNYWNATSDPPLDGKWMFIAIKLLWHVIYCALKKYLIRPFGGILASKKVVVLTAMG